MGWGGVGWGGVGNTQVKVACAAQRIGTSLCPFVPPLGLSPLPSARAHGTRRQNIAPPFSPPGYCLQSYNKASPWSMAAGLQSSTFALAFTPGPGELPISDRMCCSAPKLDRLPGGRGGQPDLPPTHPHNPASAPACRAKAMG